MILDATLPSSWYLLPEIFARERERIFLKDWLCIGRVEDIPEGDALLRQVQGQSIIVLRNEAGQLRGFYNVCRHRGAQLCGTHVPSSDGRGALSGVVGSRIRCPYHSWLYSLDGDLVGTPYMADLDPAEFALYPVGVDSWGGFLFVNLTPAEAPTLAEILGPIPDRVARYPLAALRVGHSIRYEVAANWKVIAENYNECYHCGPVHPELCAIVPAFRKAGGAGLDWDRGVPHRAGAYTFTWDGTTERAPFPDLDEDERSRHKGELVYPNLFVSLACDHATAFILQPEAPDRTVIDCLFLFAADEMAKPGFDPADTVGFWDITNRQDWAICESVQRGMGAMPHRHGWYAPMEDLTLDIRKYVEARLRDE